MKLNYNIIWVDDKIDTRPYLAMKKDLLDFVTNEFFNCEIQEAEDFNEFQDLFIENKSYDLIITDLSLNNGTTGKEVIDFIRENKHNHTEIFFYSANTQLRQQELTNSNRITFYQLTEGNYNELKNEIIDLVKLTISKFQHIVSMRGMIMHETSSLDVDFHNILKSVIEKNEEAIVIIKERFKKFNNDCNSSIDTILDIDNLLHKIGSSHRWKGLKENVSDSEIKEILKTYEDDIIVIRNKFAHAILEEDENGREFFNNKQMGITFDEVLCKTIRKNIIKHKENLDNLQSKIGKMASKKDV